VSTEIFKLCLILQSAALGAIVTWDVRGLGGGVLLVSITGHLKMLGQLGGTTIGGQCLIHTKNGVIMPVHWTSIEYSIWVSLLLRLLLHGRLCLWFALQQEARDQEENRTCEKNNENKLRY